MTEKERTLLVRGLSEETYQKLWKMKKQMRKEGYQVRSWNDFLTIITETYNEEQEERKQNSSTRLSDNHAN